MNPAHPTQPAARRRVRIARGFSLVELLVAVVIGLTVTLAVTTVLRASEATKRDFGSANDASQSGMYLGYVLDRIVRSAGSGFIQRWDTMAGCQLHAARGATALLPRTAGAGPFPAPFDGVPQVLRLAPVVIYEGGAGESDVLAVMAGSSGYAESPLLIQPNSTVNNALRLPNTLGIRPRELVLLANGVGQPCLVQQVVDPFVPSSNQTLDFGGLYSPIDVAGVGVAAFGSGSAVAAPMGEPARGAPQIQLIGVQGNGALVSLDPLRSDGSTEDRLMPIADNVVELRALYGVDSDGDRDVDAWVDPRDAASGYDAATLTSGTPAAANALRSILAVRIGVVLRTALADRERLRDFDDRGVDEFDVRLFGDLEEDFGLAHVHTVTGADRGFVYRTVDTTIPLRNPMNL